MDGKGRSTTVQGYVRRDYSHHSGWYSQSWQARPEICHDKDRIYKTHDHRMGAWIIDLHGSTTWSSYQHLKSLVCRANLPSPRNMGYMPPTGETCTEGRFHPGFQSRGWDALPPKPPDTRLQGRLLQASRSALTKNAEDHLCSANSPQSSR